MFSNIVIYSHGIAELRNTFHSNQAMKNQLWS